MSTDLSTFYKNKRVLITGHTGFKGAWLARILVGWGAHVSGIGLEPATTPNLFTALKLDSQMKSHIADVRNFNALQRIFAGEQPEIIFHLAAQPIVRDSYDDPLHTYAVNTLGTAHVLEVIRRNPAVKAGVIVTTDKVYRNRETHEPYKEDDWLGGHDPYSASKASADVISSSYSHSYFNPEEWGKTHTTLIGIARAGNVIGGGDWGRHRIIPDIVRAVYEGDGTLVLRNPDAVRPWQHVLEPLSGYLLLGQKLYAGQSSYAGAWNFGPDDESFVPVADIASKVFTHFSRGEYTIFPDHTKHETSLLKLDISKAKTVLDWHPKILLDESIALTCAWYRSFYESPERIEEMSAEQITNFFV